MDDAYRLRDRVTEREKHFIAAQYFQSRDEFDRSRDSLKVLTTLYPDDPEAHYELALVHYALEELKPGIAELRRVLALHPHGARAHGTLALLLARDNRPAEAIEATRAAHALGIDSPYLWWARGLALLGAGDLAAARADFDRLIQTPGYYAYLGRLQQARVSLVTGDLADAASRLQALADSARASNERAFELVARVQLVRTAAAGGNRALARSQSTAIEILTARPETSAVELHDAGVAALLAGDTALAARQLARLEALESATPSPLVRAARLLLAGDVALRAARPARTIALQDEALALLPLLRFARGRAEAHEALGDWRGAAAAWRTLADARGQILQDGFPPDLAAAQAGLARATARLQPARNGKDD
jgi:tetratricopeptide (TPR) repeat protein